MSFAPFAPGRLHGMLGVAMTDADDYLTADQAAQILRVTDRQARRYADAGQVRSKRLGNRVLLHREDVEALAAQQRAFDKPPTRSELLSLLERLRTELQVVTAREAALAERLRLLPTPDEVTRLREELAAIKAERDVLRAELERCRGNE